MGGRNGGNSANEGAGAQKNELLNENGRCKRDQKACGRNERM